jgi:DNA primase large subunit
MPEVIEMNEEQFREFFKNKKDFSERTPALEAVGKFLRIFVSDNFPGEIEKEIREFSTNNPEEALIDLKNIEYLVSNEDIEDQKIIDLIEFDANKPLDEPKIENSKTYLSNLADLIRQSVANTN